MLCNPLIQLHFDCACPTWYTNLSEEMKKKIQIMQNKRIRFCLKLDKMYHISGKECRLINWLPTSKRVDQCADTITYNSINNTCPYYLNEIYEFLPHCRTDTKRKSNCFYWSLSKWISLPDSIKKAIRLNTFCMYIGLCVRRCVFIYTWIYISVFSFDLSILMFFFSFTLFSHFCSDLMKQNENKIFLHVLCYPTHC